MQIVIKKYQIYNNYLYNVVNQFVRMRFHIILEKELRLLLYVRYYYFWCWCVVCLGVLGLGLRRGMCCILRVRKGKGLKLGVVFNNLNGMLGSFRRFLLNKREIVGNYIPLWKVRK
jgi:hypothetical protein